MNYVIQTVTKRPAATKLKTVVLLYIVSYYSYEIIKDQECS